ncbi:MAG: Flp1 family type IVb pilin [Oscillospiraceae bacterium]|nr:Flp1 family type IVb pilin [Oscillospiraceae bacterium]
MTNIFKGFAGSAKKEISYLIKNQKGEVNLVAILLIIIVTVGLVAIFKTQITNIINSVFDSISGAISGL